MTAKTNEPKCKRCPSTDLVADGDVTACLDCGAYTDPHHTPDREIPTHIPLTSGRPGYEGIFEIFRSFRIEIPRTNWDDLFE